MKVSIIIPTVDGYRDGLTGETLISCRNQEGFVLGVDYEIICDPADELVGKNINDAVKKAKGKYIKLCADDDLLTPNCLKDLYEKAEEGFDFVCANAINFSEKGDENIICSTIPETVSNLAEDNSFHGGTILYRKETMPPFHEYMHTAEEYEHSLRMAAMGLRFGYVDKIVFRYRIHGEQKSGVYWDEDGRRSKEKRVSRYAYIMKLQDKYINNFSRICI